MYKASVIDLYQTIQYFLLDDEAEWKEAESEEFEDDEENMDSGEDHEEEDDELDIVFEPEDEK